jgi:nucleoside-diphosphate-sugar epimerase
MEGDLRDRAVAHRAAQGMSAVFHLAANHGGRGYIDTHQVACSTNLALDSSVFSACRDAGVERIVSCVLRLCLPDRIAERASELHLSEDRVGPPYDADRLYGWAKLMGELDPPRIRAGNGHENRQPPLPRRTARAARKITPSSR